MSPRRRARSTAARTSALGAAVLAATFLPAGTAAASPAAVAASCVACGERGPVSRRALSEDAWRAIADGEVVTSSIREPSPDETARASVEVTGLVLHPPDHVWAVLTDFEAQARWQPGIEETRVVRTEGDRIWVDERLRFFLVGVRYRMIYRLEPEVGSISWTVDETTPHDIGATSGAWMLEPTAGRRSTLLTYRAAIDTGRRVPTFIASFLLQHSLPKLIVGLRAEVDQRFGAARPADRAGADGSPAAPLMVEPLPTAGGELPRTAPEHESGDRATHVGTAPTLHSQRTTRTSGR
ncbi:MAG: SRPBCC family protein [Deltaproteobacteria bacterium]|nr:SRPBCC family protein [Deltaproteobacteria bacterium]